MDTRVRKSRMLYATSLTARNFPLDPPSWSSGIYAKGVSPEFVTETITSYRGKRRPGSINSMTHTKVECLQTPFIGTRVDGYKNVLRTYSGSYPFMPSEIPPSPVIVNLKSEEAMFELMGGIPTQVSLPNMILEIPQTLTLWSSIKEVFSSKLSKGVSDATLIGSFGVAPLVGDIQTLWNLSGFISKKIEELKQSAENNSWIKFRKGISCKGSTLTPGTSSWSLVTVSDIRSDVSVTIIGKRKNTFGAPTSADVFAMWSDALGMTRPAEVIWEAVPFSFVADWFYPLGDHLKNMSSAYVQQPWIFKDVCTSIKAKGSGTVRVLDNFKDASGLSWAGGRGPTVGTINVTYHARTPGWPSLLPHSIIGAGFGLKQVGLTAALLGQKL